MLQTVLQTELQTLPYTFQRNGIYYLRYRVPKIVQKATTLPPIIRQSLPKKSPNIARKIVNSVISQLRSSLMAEKIQITFQMELIESSSAIFDIKAYHFCCRVARCALLSLYRVYGDDAY